MVEIQGEGHLTRINDSLRLMEGGAWRALTDLTMSPLLIARNAKSAAGTKRSSSLRRLVGPQRISKAMLRLTRFC